MCRSFRFRVVPDHGCRYAGSALIMDSMRIIERLRLPADIVFIIAGASPFSWRNFLTRRTVMSFPR